MRSKAEKVRRRGANDKLLCCGSTEYSSVTISEEAVRTLVDEHCISNSTQRHDEDCAGRGDS